MTVHGCELHQVSDRQLEHRRRQRASPAAQPRATDLDAAHPLRWDMCLHEGSSGEGLSLRPTLKDKTQTSPREATQPLVSSADTQALADNEKHSSDAKVRENPDADWNASWFLVIHVKASLRSLQWV